MRHLLRSKLQQLRQGGFTFVEIVVVAPIVILVVGAMITAIITLTGDVLSTREEDSLTANMQDALARINDDVTHSAGFLSTNDFTPTSPQGSNGATASFENAASGTGTVLILKGIATTDNPLASDSQPDYLINMPNACNDPAVNQNKPLTYDIVYFVDTNGTLWRRTIMPSNYADTSGTVCSKPWQQPSCTPGYTATFCKTNDEELVDGVTNLTFTYYAAANSTTTLSGTTSGADADRQTALNGAQTVGTSLAASESAGGRTVNQSLSTRATLSGSNTTSGTTITPTTTPVTPTSLSASLAQPGQVALSWNPAAGATSYIVRYSTSPTFTGTPSTQNSSGTSTTISSLSGINPYYFEVCAYNSTSASCSSWSSEVSMYPTITNGLVAWWPFNGNAYDASGNVSTTPSIGSSVLSVAGKNGTNPGAYTLAGNSTGYINFGDTLNNLYFPITVTAWVYFNTNVATLSDPIFETDANGTNYAGMFIQIEPGGILAAQYGSNTSTGSTGRRSCIGSISMSTGNWYFLVGEIRAATDMSLYVNGTADTCAYSGTGGAMVHTSAVATAGEYSPGTVIYSKDTVDDIRVYNRSLSSTEVTQLYSVGPQ